MLFKCKDTYFFSNKERFLIFFCIFACKIKGICPNRVRKSPILGWKIPIYDKKKMIPYYIILKNKKIKYKIVIWLKNLRI